MHKNVLRTFIEYNYYFTFRKKQRQIINFKESELASKEYTYVKS